MTDNETRHELMIQWAAFLTIQAISPALAFQWTWWWALSTVPDRHEQLEKAARATCVIATTAAALAMALSARTTWRNHSPRASRKAPTRSKWANLAWAKAWEASWAKDSARASHRAWASARTSTPAKPSSGEEASSTCSARIPRIKENEDILGALISRKFRDSARASLESHSVGKALLIILDILLSC